METLQELIEMGTKVTDTYEKVDENLSRAVELEALGFKKMATDIYKEIERKDKLSRLTDYIKISEENIRAFLKRKVEKYNREHQRQSSGVTDTGFSSMADYRRILEQRMHDINPFGGMSGQSARTYADALQEQQQRALIHQQMAQSRMEIESMMMPNFSSMYSSKPNSDFKLSERTCDYTNGGETGQFTYREIKLENYPSIPPKETLEVLKEHKDKHLFDYFTIGSVEKVKDPILWGRIDDSSDRYFICQWGEDISLDDVI
jgi:hypothetical protein